MNILEIKSLNKQYGQLKALDNVDLDVARGSVFGLLGPNGAGKTTLLRIINSILVKDSGSVKINGEDVSLTILDICLKREVFMVRCKLRNR